MDDLTRKFNFYCDESRVENKDSQKMAIGCLYVDRQNKKNVSNKIKEIFNSHRFIYELKWAKTSQKYLDLYKELINYFVSEASINFRCIVVDKTKIKYDIYHEGDQELAFFKFYYLMLRKKNFDNNDYYIFLDRKPTRDRNRARALKAFLDSYVLVNNTRCSIKHLQAYSSKENVLLQLSDFLTGLIAYANNIHSENSPKTKVLKYMQAKLERRNLSTGTPLGEEKLNIFVWEPHE